MAAPSKIPAAQDALKAAIAARALILADKVKVSLGTPPRGPNMREHVWISGDVEDWRQRWETTGPVDTSAREETFTLPVWCFVRRAGDTYTKPRDRALVLANEVAETLRANDGNLSGAVFSAELGRGELVEAHIEQAVFVVAIARVVCVAYLS